MTRTNIPAATLIKQPRNQPIRIQETGPAARASLREPASSEKVTGQTRTGDTRRLIGCKVGSSGIKPAATIGIIAVKILLHRGKERTNRKRYDGGGERDQHQSLFDPKTIYSSHKTKHTVNVASLLTGKAHRQHADYVPERIRRQDSL